MDGEREAEAVHITIRRYADRGGLIGALVAPVRDGLLPLLRRAPGFRGYWAFASEDGHAVSVGLFDDRESSTRADERMRGRLASELGDLLPDPPEVAAGEVVVHDEAVSERRAPEGATFVVVRYYGGLTGSPDRAARWVRADLVPRLRAQPGFRALYTFARDGDASRGGSVTLWDAEAAAARSRGIGLPAEAARLTGFASDVPDVVLMGRAAVAAAA
jgi:hypothetical protein